MDVFDGFLITVPRIGEKIDIGTVYAFVVSTILGIHEYERRRIRQHKARAGG